MPSFSELTVDTLTIRGASAGDDVTLTGELSLEAVIAAAPAVIAAQAAADDAIEVASTVTPTVHTVFKRTAGDLVLNSVTWANLPTIGETWDVVLPAVAGDVVEVGLSAFVTPASSGYTCFDVVSVVSATPVNAWGAGGLDTDWGVQAWLGLNTLPHSKGGSAVRALVEGDISGGNVRLRLRYRTSTAANQGLTANADQPFHFWVKHTRPAA